jgi:hypothetical protein
MRSVVEQPRMHLQVLLSLNLKSCCILPNRSTAASRSPAKITGDGLVSASCNSAAVMQAPDELPKDSCSTHETSESSKIIPGNMSRLVGDCPKKRGS